MDITSENKYETKLQQYKTAELAAEENDVEINYLKAKLEGLNKYFFHLNKSIKYYETQFEEATMQTIKINWKQKKAKVLLLSTEQYATKLQQNKLKTIPITPEKNESHKVSVLKKEIEDLEIKCSQNTKMIKTLYEELNKISNECVTEKHMV